MVKRLFLNIFLIFLFLTLAVDASPIMDALIDSKLNQPHFPIQGTLTITHTKNETINLKSFEIEGHPLAVIFDKDISMSVDANTVISIYHFQIPGKEPGDYFLPSISAKIGGKTTTSSPSNYQVLSEKEIKKETHGPQAKLLFTLDSTVKGPSTLYPGEKTTLFYRILYNRNIDLTYSELPLVHPIHFKKVGDVHIEDYQSEGATVQELSQEIEASELGNFSLGPSVIKGYAYVTKEGKKIYQTPLLEAKAPPISLKVIPFPKPLQPFSFNGALGSIEAQAYLDSQLPLSTGESIQLKIEVSGISNLSDLKIPLIQCQPGFSGFFKMNELPPLSEIHDEKKVFLLELIPLISWITFIPSIEFTSFDPKLNQYHTSKTKKIPIKVNDSTGLKTHFPNISMKGIDEREIWPNPIPPPLEINNQPYITQHSTTFQIRSGWLLSSILLGATLLIAQVYVKKQRDLQPKKQVPMSFLLFKKAIKEKDVHLLEQSFWSQLWERNLLQSDDRHLEKIAHLPALQEFILKLQALQYSQNRTYDFNQVIKEAKQLMTP